METKNFEEKLIGMTKPELPELKHQDELSKEIVKSKDKSVLSWWWLSLPLYIILVLVMKTHFNRGTTFYSNFHEIAGKSRIESIFAFIILPLFFIILNIISIKKVYRLAGRPDGFSMLELVWYNIFIICVSLFLIIVYLL
jgi:hypothetical protein